MRLLVTGAAGFVGRAVAARLLTRGHTVVAAIRTAAQAPPGTTPLTVGDIADFDGWAAALNGVEGVAHLAARVHVMGPQDDAAYARVNVVPTRRLALAAAQAGVGRMVFVSSVKVMGEASSGRPLTESDPPAPADAYGRSKLAAEHALAEIASGTGLCAVSLRPPLVHGPGVRANMLALMRWIDRGVPLPFAGIENRRSLIAVDSLADAVAAALEHAAPASGSYLVCDRPALSTEELIRALAAGIGRAPRLMRVPRVALAAAQALPAVGPRLARLTGDLQIDDARFRAAFGWTQREDTDAALRRTGAWFAEERLRQGA